MKKCGLTLLQSPSNLNKNEFILVAIRILIENYQACLLIDDCIVVVCLSMYIVNIKKKFNIFLDNFTIFIEYICRSLLDLFDKWVAIYSFILFYLLLLSSFFIYLFLFFLFCLCCPILFCIDYCFIELNYYLIISI